MKLIKILLFGSYLFNHLTNSIERLWIIRHCDKPNSNSNPCCSEIGYERSSKWYIYFSKVFDKTNKIQIYTSNYNEKKICAINSYFQYSPNKPNKHCQKSQRMFLTAYAISQTFINSDFTKIYYNKEINTVFCVGESTQLISHLLRRTDITDAVIVWEHTEIVDMIRRFNIKITKWPNKHIYDIVFLLDITTNKLFYECFDYLTNNTKCPSKVDVWLENTATSTISTFNNNIKSYSLQSFNPQHLMHISLYSLILYITVISVIFIVYFFWDTIYKYLCYPQRLEYIEI